MSVTGASAGSETGPSQKPTRTGARTRIVRLFGIFLLVLGWPVFFTGVFGWQEYVTGIPTTAAIDRCASPAWWNGGYEPCHGTWSVHGESHSGTIFGGFGEQVGSPVAVHLDYDSKDDPPNPYTARAESLNYYLMPGGFVLLATGLVLWWAARRKSKTGNWPGRR
jgi:hypothetical protein